MKMKYFISFQLIFFILFANKLISNNFPSYGNIPSDMSTNNIVKEIKKFNLSFKENKGQFPDNIKFYSKLDNAELFFDEKGITYIANYNINNYSDNNLLFNNTPQLSKKEYFRFNLKFINPNENLIIEGENPLDTKINYIIGNNPTKWKSNVSSYEKIIYKELYKNIDLIYYTNNDNIKYDFILKPDANFKEIKFKYKGYKTIKSDKEGNLIITFNHGKIIEAKPILYQIIDGKRINIVGKYNLDQNEVISFDINTYNKKYPLIIDPEIKYSTFLGGSDEDKIVNGIILNNDGDIIVSGMTNSTNLLPLVSGYDNTYNGSQDIFLFKFNNSLSQVKAATYIGGSGTDGYTNIGAPIALMPSGNIVITGYTTSTNFPTTQGVFGNGNNPTAFGDIFVTIFTNDLSNVVASTYLGGNGADYGQGIAVDESGNIYIAGTTTSTNFPTFVNSYQNTNKGGYDVTLTKFNSNLSSILASTYIGGAGSTELPWGMIYANNSIYIAGGTTSNDFPTTAGAYDNTFNGDRDVFICRFNTSLSSLQSSTYIGSPEYEQALGITSDSKGYIYIVGDCRSANYPTTNNAYDNVYSGSSEIFITKFSPDLTNVLASTFLGGSGDESTRAIVFTPNNEIIVGGSTSSTDFPKSTDAIVSTYNGGGDGFITKLDENLSSLIFSSFLGGSNEDNISSILYSNNNLYIAGNTKSANFPTTFGSYDVTYNGLTDVFIGVISFNGIVQAPNLISPTNNSTNVNINVSFVWNSTYEGSYRLQVSTDSLFTNIIFDTITLIKNATKKLNYNTKYYWRVGIQSFTGGYEWSSVWSFTTQNNLPEKPILVYPENYSLNVSISYNFEWQVSNNSSYYQIQISKDSSFSNIIYNDTSNNNKKNISILEYNTKYYWRVRGVNALGNGPWSEIWSFTTIILTLPEAPILISPQNLSTNVQTPVTLQWQSVNGATKYFVLVATDSLFKSLVIYDSTNNTNYVLRNLNEFSEYYWKISAKNNAGIGPYSNIWTFKTSLSNLTKPTLITPPNNSKNFPTSFLLGWSSVNGATLYHIQISEDSLFNVLQLNDSTVNTNQRISGILKNNKKYFWRVRAKNDNLISDWSEIWNFTTIALTLEKVNLIYPSNNSTDLPVNLSFKWNKVKDASYYNFQLTDDSLFNQLFINYSLLQDTLVNVQSLKNNTTYFWRVMAYSDAGNSEWSEIRRFKTIQLTLTKPRNLQPINNSVDVSIPTTFSWTSDYTNSTFQLQISNDLSFNNIIIDTILTNNSFIISNLKNKNKYYWRVKVFYNNLSSDWSDIWSFTTIQSNKLIKDPNLEQAIREEINKYDEELTENDLLSLTKLDAEFRNINDLSGIELAKNIRILILNYNEIEDISPLKSLSKIEYLDLSNNKIKQLPYLDSLRKITHLNINYNNINNIDSIRYLSTLTYLSFIGNNVVNIDPLNYLINIDTIFADENNIEIVPNISQLNKMKFLSLSYNKLSNISNLSSLKFLKYLSLDHNYINDISSISNLSSIEDISLSANNLDGLDLVNLYNLKLLSNQNIKTEINGEYFYGYLDLRYNSDITRTAVIKLDSALPLIDYSHILWDSLDIFITVSGYVKKDESPISGVKISVSGTENKYTTTDSEGKYHIILEKGGDYVITPFKEGYSFTPPSYTLHYLISDTTLDFLANNQPSILIIPNKLIFSAIQNGQKPASQTFKIMNSGNGVLKWQITNTATWLDIYPLSGNDSATITATINTTRINPGLYSTDLLITDPNATNSPQIVKVDYKVNDIILPVLQLNNTQITDINTSVNITFSLQNGNIPDKLQVFYRMGGELKYDSTVASGQNGSYSFNIPNNKITIKGIDYYIKAYYGDNEFVYRNGSNNFSILVKIPELIYPQILERKVYSMFTIFDFLDNSIYSDLVRNFGEPSSKVWRAFKWSESDFIEILDNTVKLGKGDGFWLITNTNQDKLILHNIITTPTGEPYKLKLLPGWNQIGNPFPFSISLNNIVIPTDVEKAFWKYDGKIKNYLIEENQLEPYIGYFIKNNSTQTKELIINPNLNENIPNFKESNNKDWLVSLNIETNGTKINYLTFGAKTNSINSLDVNDIGISPINPDNDVKLKAYIKTDNGKLSQDFRSNTDIGYTWNIELENLSINELFTLKINKKEYFPPSFKIEVNYAGKTFRKQFDDTTLIFNFKKTNDNTIIIKIGTNEYLESSSNNNELLPENFILYQNYPNPFNPSTNIEFFLPKEEHIKLSVYNLLGKEIANLLDMKMQKGKHKITFNPKNDLSSGIYFYRLETSTFIDVKKMIYIR